MTAASCSSRTTASLRTRSRRRRGEVPRRRQGVRHQKWGLGKKTGKGEAVEQLIADEVVDALGNVVKVKGPKKKLSRKEIKAKAKSSRDELAEGQDLTTDSDWDLDEYIGETKEKKTKA